MYEVPVTHFMLLLNLSVEFASSVLLGALSLSVSWDGFTSTKNF